MSHVKLLIDRQKELKSQRSTFLTGWQDISDFLLPRNGNFLEDRTPGDFLQDMFDTTGPQALFMAASGLFSKASNPAGKWFHHRVNNPEVLELDSVQRYLAEIRDIEQSFISRNLSENFFQVYKEWLGFGNATLFIEEDDKHVFRGRNFDLSCIFYDQNHLGDIDTVYRIFKLNARQMLQRWKPEQVSDTVRRAFDSGNGNDDFDLMHYVGPRKDRHPDIITNTNLPIISKWIETKEEHGIEEGGFHEMPYATPRLEVVGTDIYARGLGHQAMPDILTVNQGMRIIMEVAEKAGDPALDVPVNAYTSGLDVTPAAINMNQDPQGRKASQLFTVGDPRLSFQLIEERRAAIREIFFNDQLQLLNQRVPMTAFEVDQRQQNQNLLLGPFQSILEKQFFEPVIERVHGILNRKGLLPEPPQELLALGEIEITYDSPLARAQRFTDAVAIRGMLETLAASPPEISDNFKMDKTYIELAKATGFPIDLIKDSQEIADDRAERAEAAQQQQNLNQAQQGAEIAKTAGEVPPEMLEEISNQLQGAS